MVAISLARKMPDPMLTPYELEICGEVTMAKYEVPGSAILGEYIAQEFEKGYNTVMLENHGVVCGADSLFKCFLPFIR